MTSIGRSKPRSGPPSPSWPDLRHHRQAECRPATRKREAHASLSLITRFKTASEVQAAANHQQVLVDLVVYLVTAEHAELIGKTDIGI